MTDLLAALFVWLKTIRVCECACGEGGGGVGTGEEGKECHLLPWGYEIYHKPPHIIVSTTHA